MTDLTGIPGTVADGARKIRWFRMPEGATPMGRAYKAHVEDGDLLALVSRDEVEPGKRLWHVSVSHRDKAGKPDRCPTWDELKMAVYRLVDADVPFVLIFPRRSAPYLNVHDTTLHMWESEVEVDL